MIKYLFSAILVLLLFSCNFNRQKIKTSKKVADPTLEIFTVNSSIRALKAIDEKTCWFAGTDGLVGFTDDSGNTWQLDTLFFEGTKPEFRSIEVVDSSVYVMSVGSPALLFKSDTYGKNWELVYREDDPDCFYNSLQFLNPRDGYATGDPIDDHLSVLVTRNGGRHWRKVPPNLLPETFKGEAGFAASNTNIDLYGNNIWIGTGGKAARIFRSKNLGQSWEVFNTPIAQGGAMTGIFSVDFYNDSLGIIWGGNWEDQSSNSNNKAITKDGGETWTLLADGEFPGYRSCVQFVPHSGGNEIFAVGIPGIAYSFDQGENWTPLSDESFYTIRIPEKGNIAWLAGKNKIGKMTW